MCAISVISNPGIMRRPFTADFLKIYRNNEISMEVLFSLFCYDHLCYLMFPV